MRRLTSNETIFEVWLHRGPDLSLQIVNEQINGAYAATIIKMKYYKKILI